ncbi:MAG: hypothetical protein M1839_002298 [Geoglossum umbratile]|nr:MAG: hypothetical protein M1839_002298 [Geoglossum umbratile]
MVKADVSRDYYQDLELKPGADVNEIKKQFKKLALKYHPDRNPGHEQEFVPMFQAISVAHEILSDSAIKLKYDNDRQKAGYRGYPSMPPRTNSMPQRNPYGPTYYPPPPPPPPPQPRPTYNATTSSTARVFTKYAEAYQRGKQGGVKEGVGSRTERYEAWEKMKQGGGPFAGYRTPPKPTSAGASAPGHNTPNRTNTPNQTSRDAGGGTYFDRGASFSRYEDLLSGSSRARRKGFAPDAPGGDEPPAPDTSAYFSVHRSKASRPQNAPDAQPRPSPMPRKPDLMNPFKMPTEESFGEHERVSTPYATGGGERTYFSSAPLGRSTSTREGIGIQRASSHVHTMETPERTTSHRRNRSMSASRHRKQSISDDSDKVVNSPLDSPAKPDFSPINKPSRSSRERSNTNKTATDAHYRAEQGRSRYARVESDSSGNEYESRQHRSSGARARGGVPSSRRKPRMGAESTEPSYDKDNHTPTHSVPQNRSVPNPNPLDTFTRDVGGALNYQGPRDQRPASASGVKERSPFKYFHSFHNYHKTPRSVENLSMGPSSCVPEMLNESNLSQLNRENDDADRKRCASLSFQTQDDTFARVPTAGAELRSKSTENIHTRLFSPNEWSDKLDDLFRIPPPTNTVRKEHRPRSPRRPQARPPAPPRGPMLPTPAGVFTGAPAPTGLPQDPPSTLKSTGFPQVWADSIKRNDFQHPSMRVKSGRPAGAPSRVSKTTSLGATLGSDEETSTYDRSGSKSAESSSSRSSGFSGSAMEIDPPVPAQEKGRSHVLPPRPAYVPNSDEGRTPPANVGARQGFGDTPRSSRRPSATMAPPATKQPGQQSTAQATPTRQPPPRQPPPRAATSLGHSTGTEQPTIDLRGLNNVEPLASTDGLEGMSSMAFSLPFQPRSSSTTSLPRRDLELPKPPRAPEAPSASRTAEAWKEYSANMDAYVKEWRNFDDQMLTHFKARKSQVDGFPPGWLLSVGEPVGTGFLTYMQGLKQDERVRAHWTVAWDKHFEAMQAFEKAREKVLELAA